MSHNLTIKQLTVLRWLIDEIKTERLGETFTLHRPVQSSSSVDFYGSNPNSPGAGQKVKSTGSSKLIIESRGFDKQKVPDYLDFGTIDALVSDDVLIFNDRRYTLTQRAYEIEAFDFQNPNPDPVRSYIKETHRLLLQSFSREELTQVCFGLGINTDWVFGEKTDWPFELLLYLYQNNRLNELTPVLRERRPAVTWPDFPEKKTELKLGTQPL